MVDDRQAERARVGERGPQDRRRQDRRTIVGEADDAGVRQLADARQAIALAARRDRSIGEQLDRRSGRGRGRPHLCQDARFVERRGRVGHRADRREAPVRRRGEAGCHGLRVLVAGLTKVDMEVDEARRHDDAVRVDPSGRGARQPGDRLEDPSRTTISPAPSRPAAGSTSHARLISRSGPDPLTAPRSRGCRPAGRAWPSGPRRRWSPGR